MTPIALAWIHAVATLAMLGLLWFVQVVHYPLMALVGEVAGPRYARRNQALTTVVVAPLMVVEAVTAVALVLICPGCLLNLAGVVLLATIWVSTALLQVPQHRRLARAHDDAVVRELTCSNWVRTIAWSGRAGIALAMLPSGVVAVS